MVGSIHINITMHDHFLPDKPIDLVDEAGSQVRLRHAQLPEEARELEKELRQITKEKNEAVRSQDYEKVTGVLDVNRSKEKGYGTIAKECFCDEVSLTIVKQLCQTV